MITETTYLAESEIRPPAADRPAPVSSSSVRAFARRATPLLTASARVLWRAIDEAGVMACVVPPESMRVPESRR